MKLINEEYTSYYKYLSDKDKEAFNNAEWGAGRHRWTLGSNFL
jgi:hypothetical protein